MKNGKYFRIPETLDDVGLLRKQASSIEDSTCPDWLLGSDRGYYLYIGSAEGPSVSSTDIRLFQSEMEEMHTTGLLVCEDKKYPGKWGIYVTSDPLYDDWSIGIYSGNSPLSLSDDPHTLNPVISREDISDVQAVFVADPFMIQHENCWFMFFEILNWRANKGEIGLATSEDGVIWKYEARVLVEPFHLSYPYVFCCDGNFYMMPEAKQSGAVRLYRASAFPHSWSLISTLFEGEDLVDSTVFFSHSRWWILASAADSQGNDILRLFFSDSLEGAWREHTGSPFDNSLYTHVRPAGRVVESDGKLFRFAQNRYGPYGTSVCAYEITQITKNSYKEIPVDDEPIMGPTGESWAASGMHHIDTHLRTDGTWFACVDGRP